MKALIGGTVCLTLAACAMSPNMSPVALQVPGRPSRFVGDTLILAVLNRVQPPLAGVAVEAALTTTMRTAFPAAIVLESLVDTAPAPRRVLITATLVKYGPSWEGRLPRWTGHTAIDVFVVDHRGSAGSRFVALIRTSASSSRFSGGNKAMGDVSRASFDSANVAMVAFLDSVDDPRARETLRFTAGVSDGEYASYLATTGIASLTGRAFIMTGGRSEQPAAGQPVTLDPATSSARRWYERFGMVCNAFDSSASPDDLFRRTRRMTVTDADGNFAFSGLPPGTYFVRTRVLWDAPEPTDGSHAITQQYAFVSSEVKFKEGEQKRIALSQTGNAYLRCPSPMRGVGGRPKAGYPY